MITKKHIKFIQSLQQKKYRDLHNAYVTEGLKLVAEAIKIIPESIEILCYTQSTEHLIDMKSLSSSSVLIKVQEKKFGQISSLKTPQQVLAVLTKPLSQPVRSGLNSDLTLILDGVRDPGNMGTIIRFADWFGISDIICSYDTVDCYNPKVVQSTMGAILRVNVKYTDLADYLTSIKKENKAFVYGALLSGVNIHTVKIETPAFLVLGNESTGISKELIPLLDQRLSIPNYSSKIGKSESLNVAIAGAIICSEICRQVSAAYSK